MRYPEKNSRGEKILKAFYEADRALTIYQGEELHGSFATRAVPDGIDHELLVGLYCELVERGCLIREGIKYRLSMHAKMHIERKADEGKGTPVLSVVGPRVIDMFTKALRIGYTATQPYRVAL